MDFGLVAKLCPTLCDPMDCSLPGSFAQGVFQARILEWLPFPSSVDLPHSGIEPGSPAMQPDSLPTELPGKAQRKLGCGGLVANIYVSDYMYFGMLLGLGILVPQP